ncbi:MAG: Crp/Fnr family transcriptional regulator [Pirellulales bacterium]|nr:Crp/Fnr family transcriptional regulator [Pirellulales bacterium]
MSRNVLTETLENIQFLRDMEPEYVERIANIAQVLEFDEYDVVFREGDPADYLYLIAHGSVSLELCAPGTGCRQVLSLGAGELLGWSSLLGQARYTARARTPQAAQLVQLNVKQLLALCEHDPRFGYELMRRTAIALAKRLSATRIQLLNVYGDAMPATPHEVEEK